METASAQAFLVAETAALVRGLALPVSDVVRVVVRLNPITAAFPPLPGNSALVARPHRTVEKLARADELGSLFLLVVEPAHCASRAFEAVDAAGRPQARAIADGRETLLFARSCDKKVVATLVHVMDHAELLHLIECSAHVVAGVMMLCPLHVVLLVVSGQQAWDPLNGRRWEASVQP